jgi:hypothetical protein
MAPRQHETFPPITLGQIRGGLQIGAWVAWRLGKLAKPSSSIPTGCAGTKLVDQHHDSP